MTQKQSKQAQARRSSTEKPGQAKFGEPWEVQGDPEKAHLHEFHARRYITTKGLDLSDNAVPYQGGFIVCEMRDHKTPEIGERITACVNACAGMEDPGKEIGELRARADRWEKTARSLHNEAKGIIATWRQETGRA
jgi:hypothetical protein